MRKNDPIRKVDIAITATGFILRLENAFWKRLSDLAGVMSLLHLPLIGGNRSAGLNTRRKSNEDRSYG
jgi:predicted DNA-binding ribbon-helix-helix protein